MKVRSRRFLAYFIISIVLTIMLCACQRSPQSGSERSQMPDRESDEMAEVAEDYPNRTRRGPIRASRGFLGPHDYPPGRFQAYGILAFPARATNRTWERHMMFCFAYVATLPHWSNENVSPSEQMITVWPVSSDSIASQLNGERGAIGDICEMAVDRLDLSTSLEAIRDAKRAGVELDGRGPYLLAWSPAQDKGKAEAPILQLDLSTFNTYEQISEVMQMWRNDIEDNPDIWTGGWSFGLVRLKIRNWADQYGSEILALINWRD